MFIISGYQNTISRPYTTRLYHTIDQPPRQAARTMNSYEVVNRSKTLTHYVPQNTSYSEQPATSYGGQSNMAEGVNQYQYKTDIRDSRGYQVTTAVTHNEPRLRPEPQSDARRYEPRPEPQLDEPRRYEPQPEPQYEKPQPHVYSIDLPPEEHAYRPEPVMEPIAYSSDNEDKHGFANHAEDNQDLVEESQKREEGDGVSFPSDDKHSDSTISGSERRLEHPNDWVKKEPGVEPTGHGAAVPVVIPTNQNQETTEPAYTYKDNVCFPLSQISIMKSVTFFDL